MQLSPSVDDGADRSSCRSGRSGRRRRRGDRSGVVVGEVGDQSGREPANHFHAKVEVVAQGARADDDADKLAYERGSKGAGIYVSARSKGCATRNTQPRKHARSLVGSRRTR